MSVSKVAGVYIHEKCSWYWLEKRMMTMTRDGVAVGQREYEMANSLHEDSPVVDICEGGRCERFVCGGSGCSRAGEVEAGDWIWLGGDDGGSGEGWFFEGTAGRPG